MRVWQTLARLLSQHQSCAMVTLIEVAGSAPQVPGARLIVAPDGGFHGTIGGGALEWQALAAAQRLLEAPMQQAAWSRHALGPQLGQCCGGSVRILTETFDRTALPEITELAEREAAGRFATSSEMSANPLRRQPLSTSTAGPAVTVDGDGSLIETFGDCRRPVVLFGAGHVGRAAVLALAPLPFDVCWVDARADAFPAAVPGNVRPLAAADPVSVVAGAADDSFLIIMTHSHALDLDILHAALECRRFAYVGLIGSATKRGRFLHRLRDAGLTADHFHPFVCPIGIDGISGKQPAVIAAALAADLIRRDEQLSAGQSSVRSTENRVSGRNLVGRQR